ncbi:uncharacterized protein LOC106012878 isoform X2 [Aplysia californica]|uniref:Uncharacterized protein LOC106012878 isoform X2 n=1 Tax=Aplysia californica TaxID=6500 RepID=A0ABM1A7W2_APLCA|nr:uncharacterized protein LOC106012878 isoform X2 [Aplysia californica]
MVQVNGKVNITHMKVVAVVLLLAGTSLVKGSRKRSEPQPYVKSLQPHTNPVDCNIPLEERYNNLFLSDERIRTMSQSRDLGEVFKIDNVKFSYDFPGICASNESLKSHRLKSSNSQPTCKQRSSVQYGNTCCETKMTFTVPSSVVSVYDGSSYNVVHNTDSYQLVHEASCESLGKSCAPHGVCSLKERIQWILVDKGSYNSFVPVRIGNHCICQHS